MPVRALPYHEKLAQVALQLPKGAFLTAKAGDETNVMTIGWCLAGFMWNRPIFQIVVRTSRHTYALLERGRDFAVSFPFEGKMGDELLYCGTHSGKTADKIEACGLKLLAAQKIGTPVIGGCDLYYECKVVAKGKLPLERIDGQSYEDDADAQYHVMYYGEIAASYTLD